MSGAKILVIGPAWIGDMVMAQTLFKTLKLRYPECQIDVAAPAWTLPLLAHMPEVHQALPAETQRGKLGLIGRIQVARGWRQNQYDQAIVLPNSWKSALFPFLAHIPRRTGWRGEWRYGLLNDVRVLDKSKYPLMIQRFAALAYPKGVDLPEKLPWPELNSVPEQALSLAAKFHFDLSRPAILLAPGAEYGPAKRWPTKHFAQIARVQREKGYQIVIAGSPKDAVYAEEIEQQAGSDSIINITGKTSISEAIHFMSLVKAVVTNDSGLMHIAAALKKPLVALYGSSAPSFTPPLSHDAKILSLQLACSPCFKRDCPLGHTNCLVQLSPERVVQALDELNGA